MANVWTHGTWIVKLGSEVAFVEAWTRLARSSSERPEIGRPFLLRDRERPNVFKSFGSFRSIEDIEAFRSSDVFREAVAETQPLLESFEPMTLDEVEWA